MSNFFTYQIFRKHPQLDASPIWNWDETGFPINASKGKLITIKVYTGINAHFFSFAVLALAHAETSQLLWVADEVNGFYLTWKLQLKIRFNSHLIQPY